MDPELRQRVLGCYRPARFVPCFLQRYLRAFRLRWRTIPIIVQIENNQAGILSARDVATAARLPVKRELPLINAVTTTMSIGKLEQLVQSELIKRVWFDRDVHAVLDVATPTVQSSPLWADGITGRGIVVAVIDTGIYYHPDLRGRIIGFKDLVARKEQAYDDNGHGTHVAGDIAGDGSQSGSPYRGPAPEAQLVGVKVLNKAGSGSLSSVIEGIQWCILNRLEYKIRIINMSLGSQAVESYKDDPVCLAAEAAWEAGIVVCVAAGNSGPEARTIASPGIDPRVITVGALDDYDSVDGTDDAVAGFSSRGPTIDDLPKPDVISPGVSIVSLRSPGSLLDKQNKDARIGSLYTSLSGTSMATPICAGVAAQILQARPELEPDEVKQLLMRTAKPLPDSDENDQGSGVIDALAAARSETQSSLGEM